jgi:hypothetical protein
MNRKDRQRAGLFFGVFMTLFYFLQSILTSDNLTTPKAFIAIGVSVITGAASGLLFVWLLGVFLKLKPVREAAQVVLEEEERILYQSPANHFVGMEAVGGMLTLTNQRLLFKSHRFNIQNHLRSINLSAIKVVDTYKNLGMINNGLIVTTDTNHTEKFVVSELSEWVTKLNDTLSGLQQPALQKQG